MILRPDLLDADSPEGIEVVQLTDEEDVPGSHVYMEAQVFTPDSRRFVLHRSAHPLAPRVALQRHHCQTAPKLLGASRPPYSFSVPSGFRSASKSVAASTFCSLARSSTLRASRRTVEPDLCGQLVLTVGHLAESAQRRERPLVTSASPIHRAC